MNGATVIPTMRYKDAPAAIRWLCEALGFEPRLVVPGEEDGVIAHAQFVLGSGTVMLGSERDDRDGKAIRSPSDAGCVTRSVLLVVREVEAHCERARAAGAEIGADRATPRRQPLRGARPRGPPLVRRVLRSPGLSAPGGVEPSATR